MEVNALYWPQHKGGARSSHQTAPLHQGSNRHWVSRLVARTCQELDLKQNNTFPQRTGKKRASNPSLPLATPTMGFCEPTAPAAHCLTPEVSAHCSSPSLDWILLAEGPCPAELCVAQKAWPSRPRKGHHFPLERELRFPWLPPAATIPRCSAYQAANATETFQG